MKKLLKPILLLVLGFACGAIATCYLSMRASSYLIDVIEIDYQLEQQVMAIRAKKQGNLNQAVIHYSNLAAASSSPGLNCFTKVRKYWSMWFPFTSIMYRRMFDPISEKSKKTDEAFNRAVLADALEKSGRMEEANSEYIKAAHLFGWNNDISKVKKAVEGYMKSEDTVLKVHQDSYIYPQK